MNFERFACHIILVLLAFTCLALNTVAKEPDKIAPFETGEKLTYTGRWGMIPAGQLTLEILPKKNIDGTETYHFAMITKTNEAVDLIYKIRDRQDSYIDAGLTHSILYTKKTESKHPRDEVVTFNWDKSEVTYSNFGKKKPPINILPGSFDPLALFYIVRCQSLKENSGIYIPLTDGKRNIAVKAIVGKKSIIEVGGKTYEAIEIMPDVKKLYEPDKDEIADKKENPQLRIWISADKKKIPLKIRTQIGIISFDFDYVPNLH